MSRSRPLFQHFLRHGASHLHLEPAPHRRRCLYFTATSAASGSLHYAYGGALGPQPVFGDGSMGFGIAAVALTLPQHHRDNTVIASAMRLLSIRPSRRDSMAASSPYVVSDDDGDDIHNSDTELELLDYESDGSEPEITGYSSIASSASSSSSSSRKSNSSIKSPDTEIARYKLSKGCTIKIGDTVELKDSSAHEGDLMHSGDFLRIKHIIMNLQIDEVRLRGLRLRRTKYFKQIFDWKLNELSVVIHVKEDDSRCPFDAGMEDVPVSRVLRPRDCVLTNKPYPFLSFRDDNLCSYPAGLTEKEVKRQIFHGGRLACRVVNIVFISKNGKPYSGIVRHLYSQECDIVTPTGPNHGPGQSRATPIPIIDDEPAGPVASRGLSSQGRRRARSPSVEIVEAPTKRISPHPVKQGHYTFGDIFCGAGGASQGAKQAGLYVAYGVDMDELAIQAYGQNHQGARPYRKNAHDFPPSDRPIEYFRVDVLHLSPPCCFFSPAHTRDGPNDQANLEAIYTVGPILKKVKPRVATLEQTFGLATHEQHKANFYMLLHDIGDAGYDMRYKIQDLSKHGLVQQRKRLLIIAARRGHPLPPFPKATHGPPGSGLKPFHYIHDALQPIRTLANRATPDFYHQPKPSDKVRPAYSPHSFLKGCITSGGGENYHPSGQRRFTPRELSLFQSFPYEYKWTGGMGEATKQIGNAFPPVVAEALYRTITKTLEAFDKGYIEAEDDITDLDEVLRRKGVVLGRQRAVGGSVFDVPVRAASQPSRYLIRDENAGSGATFQSSPFARTQVSTRRQPGMRAASAFENMGLMDELLGDNVEDEIRPSVETAPCRPFRAGSTVEDAIEVLSSSEEENDEED